MQNTTQHNIDPREQAEFWFPDEEDWRNGDGQVETYPISDQH